MHMGKVGKVHVEGRRSHRNSREKEEKSSFRQATYCASKGPHSLVLRSEGRRVPNQAREMDAILCNLYLS